MRSGLDRGRLQLLADDFLQYYLGAYDYNEDAGTTANGKIYDVFGMDDPFATASLDVRDAERGQPGSQRLVHRDEQASCPPRPVPAVTSWTSAKYDRPGGPFEPAHGRAVRVLADRRLGVQAPDADDRPHRQADGNLSFWMSNDTEADWDFVFVEAHTVGQNDWTTLPDQNGHTSRARLDRPDELSGGLGGASTRSSRTTRRTTRTARARRPAPPASWNADVRRLGRLAAVVDRPVRVRGQAGRGLDLLRERLVDPGTRRLRGRHRPSRPARARPRSRTGAAAGRWSGPPPGSAPNPND